MTRTKKWLCTANLPVMRENDKVGGRERGRGERGGGAKGYRVGPVTL